jgi:spermidine/putrescine ABC transporter ATP-binding subunit
MPKVRLERVTKRYGKVTAVDCLDLTVHEGEILTLLGPSGCGKTTTLRCIAGFVVLDEGHIFLGEEEVTHLPPEKRDIGFVFQNYALWPHMTVYQNLSFGLQLRRIPKEEIRERVQEVLSMVRLSGMEDRYPRQLSGGQQQRVALARALALRPRVLLLDEPLSNLDAKLREEMRFEIRELQRQLGITAIYVTHDQAEALVLSDRIAVLNEGRLVQLGTPEEIYQRPANRFVAGFIGLSSFIEARVTEVEAEMAVLETEDGLHFRVPRDALVEGQAVTLAVRPEHVEVLGGPSGDLENAFQAEVVRAAYLGDSVDCRLRLGKWELRTQLLPGKIPAPGEVLWIYLPPEKLILIPG